MSEQAEVIEVVDAPTAPDAGPPPMTPEMREAFATRAEAPAPAPAAPAEPATPTEPATPATPTTAAAPVASAAPDYGDLLKELGVDTVDALKERWTAAKEYDPKAVETLKANQRDAQDLALREMVATDPAKARAYFDLQSLKPDELATGTVEDQRSLLLEKFKLDNPTMSAKLAALEFEEEYEQKFALLHDEEANPNDPAVIRAKERHAHAVSQATPAVKAAQEAAKIALVPKPEAADGLTPEQQKALDDKWMAGVTNVLAQPKIEQVFQTENGAVTVGYDTKDAELGAFLEKPLDAVSAYLNKVAYPNGFDQPADMAALAQAYLRLTKPEAIATAAAAVGKASVGAHVPMERLTNPTPTAPQAPAGGGEDQAGALAAIRAVAQGRR